MSDSLTVFGTDYTGVTGIKAKGTGNGTLTYIRPAGTKSISANGTGIDVTEYAAVDVSVSGSAPNLQAKTNIAPTTSSQTITADSGYDGLSSVQINAMPSGSVTAPSTISGTGASVSASNGTLTLSKTVSVTPSVTTAGYVSSGTAGNSSVSLSASVSTRSSSDLTASGATVTAPAGYYASQATKSVSSMTLPTAASASSSGTSKATISRSTSDQYINIPTGYNSAAAYYKVSAVANGTEGTPTATKGTVSNHQVSVTPSVTNTAGYISGGTKTGTAVTVSASELVDGTYSVNSSGTKDVTNYASVSVPAGTAGTPTATKGTVSNHQVSVTPSVTNTAGYISGSTKTGTAVTVTASELASGNLALSANTNSTSCVGYSTVSVAVPIVTYYTSSSNPTSSQGSNGDIWLVTS